MFPVGRRVKEVRDDRVFANLVQGTWAQVELGDRVGGLLVLIGRNFDPPQIVDAVGDPLLVECTAHRRSDLRTKNAGPRRDSGRPGCRATSRPSRPRTSVPIRPTIATPHRTAGRRAITERRRRSACTRSHARAAVRDRRSLVGIEPSSGQHVRLVTLENRAAPRGRVIHKRPVCQSRVDRRSPSTHEKPLPGFAGFDQDQIALVRTEANGPGRRLDFQVNLQSRAVLLLSSPKGWARAGRRSGRRSPTSP